MPTSKLSYALPVILAMTDSLRDHQRYSILDIGPGLGKYGALIREYLGDRLHRVDAVEAEPRYFTPRLIAQYDNVICGDARRLAPRFLDRYDLVLMVDVIEHLTLDEGHELLSRIKGAVVITTPTVYFQNPEADQGWPTEEHKTLWRAGDFPQDRLRCATLLPEEGLLICLTPR